MTDIEPIYGPSPITAGMYADWRRWKDLEEQFIRRMRLGMNCPAELLEGNHNSLNGSASALALFKERQGIRDPIASKDQDDEVPPSL